jgi:hypothetical protein
MDVLELENITETKNSLEAFSNIFERVKAKITGHRDK